MFSFFYVTLIIDFFFGFESPTSLYDIFILTTRKIIKSKEKIIKTIKQKHREKDYTEGDNLNGKRMAKENAPVLTFLSNSFFPFSSSFFLIIITF
jgi:hypothetical protein